MENLLLFTKSQINTPIIDFKVNGELSIAGRSTKENIDEYYQPALDWILAMMVSPPASIFITIKIDIFNSKSGLIILHILKMLEFLNSKKLSKVQVNWFYEEENIDMYESGKDYQSIVNLPFNILSLVQ